ncbi:hypothetical protein HPB50_028475 [Hyalomma asiaticum]|nr:hypothetical protein HPB50_028475 [Hyalomma asiaticum]
MNSRGGRKRKPWWDAEVRAALEARRAANRRHRKAVKTLTTEVCQQTWQEYIACKTQMQGLVQCKIAEYDSVQIRALAASGRNGAKKFWTYVSSLDRTPPQPTLRHESNGQAVTDLQKHIRDHLQALYDSTHDSHETVDVEPAGQPSQSEESNIWQVTRVAIDRAMARISAHTAQGPDGIPAGLIKCLGDNAREHLAVTFSGIVAGEEVPADGQYVRVTLLCKRGGDRGLLRDYRPLTLIEIAQKESRGLVACFLDVAKAYDSVPQDLLLQRMTDLEMPRVWTDLLRRLYRDNTVVARFCGVMTEPVAVKCGLKQGCPLSPPCCTCCMHPG